MLSLPLGTVTCFIKTAIMKRLYKSASFIPKEVLETPPKPSPDADEQLGWEVRIWKTSA